MKYKNLIKLSLSVVASCSIMTSLQARELQIVGSSTVFPFASNISNTLSNNNEKIDINSNGSGTGFKLFCSGNGLDTPDITNSSRKMKLIEFETCEKNGVNDITEVVIGYDGIVFVESGNKENINVTPKQLALALAEEVPDSFGGLIPNPYKTWDEIDKSLPKREIIIYGPPVASGTRDTFEEMVISSTLGKTKEYTSLYDKDKDKYKNYKNYSKVRQDGVYIPIGENDDEVIKDIEKNPDSIGVFGYSFLLKNNSKIKALNINNINPENKTISEGTYPLSRPLYFYIKNSHKQSVPMMKKYIETFVNEKMLSNGSEISKLGLVSLPEKEMKENIKNVSNSKKLTKEELN